MSYQKYLNINQDIQNKLFLYLDKEDNIEEHYQNLINLFSINKILENRYELKSILYLISKVSNNHNRISGFFNKIEKVLQYFSLAIKYYFSNLSIFNIFKKCKLILLILIKQEIIVIDQPILNKMKSKKYIERNYHLFFGAEIYKLIKNEKNQLINKKSKDQSIFDDSSDDENNIDYDDYDDYDDIDDFDVIENEKSSSDDEYTNILSDNENSYNNIIINEDNYFETIKQFAENLPENYSTLRENGENDDYICKLIRNDLIDEFITYVNKNDISLNSTIKQSIYETNQLLTIKIPTLIEYAAFYGSVQIFRYLYLNNVKLTPSLWIYGIHSDNPELINILEENYITTFDMTYEKCFKEAIKCHHNDVANYIKDNYLNTDEQSNCKENILSYIFHYYNFSFFPNTLDYHLSFFNACKYDYCIIVENFLKEKAIDLNEKDNVIILLFYITAINCACEKDNFEIIELFLKEQNIVKQNCFIKSKKLTQLIIPSSIVIIEEYAFAKCISLNQILISPSVVVIKKFAFFKCHSLIQIKIPFHLTIIDDYVFYKCFSLKDINLPTSIVSIGKGAFKCCSSLNQLTLPLSVVSIGDEAFKKCVSLEQIIMPLYITLIAEGSFAECLSLTKIDIPSSVKLIGNYAFYECTSLVKIQIPSSVKSIGCYSFKNCTSLTEVLFETPSSLMKIGYCAFKNCISLKTISIPFTVTSIEEGIFAGCSSLTKITINPTNEIEYDEEKILVFKTEIIDAIYDTVLWVNENLNTLIIPSFIKKIGAFSFYGCSLTQISIPSSVTSIGRSAFYKCSKLKKIMIPSSVTYIGDNAFYECISLKHMTVPESLAKFTVDKDYLGIISKVKIQYYK